VLLELTRIIFLDSISDLRIVMLEQFNFWSVTKKIFSNLTKENTKTFGKKLFYYYSKNDSPCPLPPLHSFIGSIKILLVHGFRGKA
jgi:hypothetical protein